MRKQSIITLLLGISILLYGITSILSDGRYTSDSILYSSLRNEMICIMSFGSAIFICGLVMCIFYKAINKHCALKTSLLSLGLSGTVALGLYCGLVMISNNVFDELGRHPFSDSASNIGCLVALIIFAILMLVYVKNRRRKPSSTGVVIDVLFSLIYIVPFFYTYLNVHSYISDWLAAYYDKIG